MASLDRLTSSPAARLAGFALGLLAVLGLGLGAGRLVGPEPVAQAAEPEHAAADEHGGEQAPVEEHAQDGGHAEASGHADEGGHADAATAMTGLAASDRGYGLVLEQTTAVPGTQELAFSVTGPDGHAVTAFDVAHDKELHLVAVRRDLTGFQHVHPAMDADGRWTTALDLTPGAWKVFADVVPSELGENLALGTDLLVAGDLRPEELPAPTTTAEVDGYDVALDGALVAGQEQELTFTVSRDGVPVDDLEPYLAANGHLVALRAGDLGYLHVHPLGSVDDQGPAVSFAATAPSAGSYRLFLDFQHDGVVRTAAFTVTVEADHDH